MHRVLHIGDSWQNDTIEIGHHIGERLGASRRDRRQGGTDVTRFDLGQNRQRINRGAVVGDPIDECMARFSELIGSHGPRLLMTRPASGPRYRPDRQDVIDTRRSMLSL